MKQIPDFPNYSITKDGRVWSKKRHNTKGGQLKPGIDKHGYSRVVLCNNGKTATKKVHRLVLETFVGPCPKGMECRHLDGNPANNNLDNLKWGTKSENIHDSVKHGTHNTANHFGDYHPNSKLSAQQKRLIIYQYLTGLFSQKKLAQLYGVNKKLIYNLIRGKQWPFINAKSIGVLYG